MTSPRFSFKYVVIEGGNIVRWEQGDQNRDIDLDRALQNNEIKQPPSYFVLKNSWDVIGPS